MEIFISEQKFSLGDFSGLIHFECQHINFKYIFNLLILSHPYRPKAVPPSQFLLLAYSEKK